MEPPLPVYLSMSSKREFRLTLMECDLVPPSNSPLAWMNRRLLPSASLQVEWPVENSIESDPVRTEIKSQFRRPNTKPFAKGKPAKILCRGRINGKLIVIESINAVFMCFLSTALQAQPSCLGVVTQRRQSITSSSDMMMTCLLCRPTQFPLSMNSACANKSCNCEASTLAVSCSLPLSEMNASTALNIGILP